MSYENTARYYSFDLASNVSPSTFEITDFDGDGNWELTFTQFDRNGLGEIPQELVILEFRDVVPSENISWIFEAEGSLVDITAEIFANDPNGIPKIENGRQMIVKDINGDGYDDLVVANQGYDPDPSRGGTNIIAVSDGRGGLVDLAGDFETDTQFTHSMAAGDFDGDGRTDFFFGNLIVDPAYFATLDGTSAEMNSFPLVPDSNLYTRSHSADLDGDGRDELFLGGDEGTPDRIARWTGNGWKTTVLPTEAAQTTLDFGLGDVNGDGREDLIVLSTGQNGFYQGIRIDVLLQTAAGNFANASAAWINSAISDLPASAWASNVNLADLDGDGDLDMTLSVQYPNNDRVLWNTGSRFSLGNEPTTTVFGEVTEGAWGHDPDATSLLAKDLDGDGVAEVIALELGIVTIYHYNTPVETGTAGDDTMHSGAWADAILHGGAGSDLLHSWNGDDLLYGEAGDDTLNGWRDNDTLYGGAGDDSLIAGDGMDLAYGGMGNDTIEATETWDWADPTQGANIFFGEAGDDSLWGGYGADTLVGGPGYDTLDGQNGFDTLYGDGLDFTASENAARVFRLYQATLGRAPDATGFENWTWRLDLGLFELRDVVTGFVASPEFRAVYGALSDESFVTLLYNNVLDRDPDAAGLANWSARLAGGMSREQVVLGFSESTEFITNTGAAVTNFAAERMEANWTDDVYRLYLATLGRDPDVNGFKNWSARLAEGSEYLSVAAGFVNSQEFQNVYGDLDDRGFVTLLYNNVLDRTPDEAGLASWVQRLESGEMDRTEVLRGFAQSAEFVKATQAGLNDYMRDLGADDVLHVRARPDSAYSDGTEEGRALLHGGAYADRFEIETGDVDIADLEPWDTIVLPNVWVGDDRLTETDLLSMLQQDGSDVTLDLQETWGEESYDIVSLRLLDTQISDISVDNFVLQYW